MIKNYKIRLIISCCVFYLLGTNYLSIAQEQAALNTKDTEDMMPLEAVYDNGFYLKDKDGKFSVNIGGLVQTDYRYFSYNLDEGNNDPPKNKFDLRRIRLRFGGNITERFDYKMEFEHEGAGGGSNLLDAYVDTHINPNFSFRVGQFKEPFGLEQTSRDKELFFAERSMGYYLMPHWDLGIMAQISAWDDRLYGYFGLFNGDGKDNSTGGNEDSPQFTGRAVTQPLKKSGFAFLENLQLGASLEYANIDNNNVNIHIKTTGLTEFFDVSSNAKFNIIRDAGTRKSFGADAAWTYGPLAAMGEAVKSKYSDIKTSTDLFSTQFTDIYMSFLFMVTGERPSFLHGSLQPVQPLRSVWDGGWGALGLAFRYDVFKADILAYENLIERTNSVREAKSFSFASNWYLTSSARFTFDATRTNFDGPLIIYYDSLTATTVLSDCEYVYTGRFQFQF